MIRLKELRELKGMTQLKMAAELNLTKSTYNFWENGKVEIDFKNLIRLADYFNVSIDYLLGRDYVNKLASLSEDENRLIENYRNCDDKNKAAILGYSDGIAKRI